jgi:heme/copper-type cytochrome/quinol oxidase subunit 2
MSAPKNIGNNRWTYSFSGEVVKCNNYIHLTQMRSQHKWVKSYWEKVSTKLPKGKKPGINLINEFNPFLQNRESSANYSCFFKKLKKDKKNLFIGCVNTPKLVIKKKPFYNLFFNKSSHISKNFIYIDESSRDIRNPIGKKIPIYLIKKQVKKNDHTLSRHNQFYSREHELPDNKSVWEKKGESYNLDASQLNVNSQNLNIVQEKITYLRNKYYKSTFFLAKKKQEIIKEMIKGMSAVELIKLYINDTSGEIPSNDGNSNNPSGCSPDGDDNDPKETSNNDNSNNSLKQLKSLNGLKIIFGQAEEVNIKIAREAAIKKAKIQRCLNLSKLVESCTKVVLTSKKMELIEWLRHIEVHGQNLFQEFDFKKYSNQDVFSGRSKCRFKFTTTKIIPNYVEEVNVKLVKIIEVAIKEFIIKITLDLAEKAKILRARVKEAETNEAKTQKFVNLLKQLESSEKSVLLFKLITSNNVVVLTKIELIEQFRHKSLLLKKLKSPNSALLTFKKIELTGQFCYKSPFKQNLSQEFDFKKYFSQGKFFVRSVNRSMLDAIKTIIDCDKEIMIVKARIKDAAILEAEFQKCLNLYKRLVGSYDEVSFVCIQSKSPKTIIITSERPKSSNGVFLTLKKMILTEEPLPIGFYKQNSFQELGFKKFKAVVNGAKEPKTQKFENLLKQLKLPYNATLIFKKMELTRHLPQEFDFKKCFDKDIFFSKSTGEQALVNGKNLGEQELLDGKNMKEWVLLNDKNLKEQFIKIIHNCIKEQVEKNTRALSVPILPYSGEQGLSRDKSQFLYKFRFNDINTNTNHRVSPKAQSFYFNQKRYKKRNLITPITINYKNKKKDCLEFKSHLNLKDNYKVLPENNNKKKLTTMHKLVRKSKSRNDNMVITVSKRLLRVKRTLVIPTHVNITAITNSYDVVHSWFIPGLGLKMDCVPGRSTHHTFYVDNAGFYYGQCAEICGRYHHHMPIRVCALPFEHFLLWWNAFGLPKLIKNKNKSIRKEYSFRKFVW